MEHDHALKLMDPLHQDSSQVNLDFALFLLVRVHRPAIYSGWFVAEFDPYTIPSFRLRSPGSNLVILFFQRQLCDNKNRLIAPLKKSLQQMDQIQEINVSF